MIHKIENWLRISRFEVASDLVRARMIYGIGLAFIFMQSLNLLIITKIYGGWTLDHSLIGIAMIIVAANVIQIRYKKAFTFSAINMMTICVLGIAASASVEYTGISSAVLPLLPVAIFIAGIISGWRMSIACGIVGLFLTLYLYNFSMTCLLYTSPSPRDATLSRMPSSA